MRPQALLRLCRIPNVFTAAANVAAGVVLARGGRFAGEDLALVGASMCLYLAGMVLNDYFDRDVDALERPDRPIPAGEVSATAAALLGFGLLSGGVLLAMSVGSTSGRVAAALAAAIVGYDALLKWTPLAPFTMGLCRFLNVLLGLSVAPWPDDWRWVAPVAAGFYTAVITYLSRDEVGGGRIERTRAAAYMMAVLFVAFLVALGGGSPARQWSVFLLVAPFLFVLAARGRELFRPLLAGADAGTIGRAIGGGILLMPVIDAACVAAAGHLAAALVVAALALPAMALKRWYYVT